MRKVPTSKQASITIGVCTYQREEILRKTLPSLLRAVSQSESKPQILVCDNGSTDGTERVVQAIGGSDVEYLKESRRGKCYALTSVIEKATGTWLILVDDDLLVNDDWYLAYQNAIESHSEAECFGGAISPYCLFTPSWLQQQLMLLYPAVFGILKIPADCKMSVEKDLLAYGGNMTFRLESLRRHSFDLQLGMFGSTRVSGEDSQLVTQVLQAGGEGWLLANAEANHCLPPSRVSLQAFGSWFAGKGRAARRHEAGKVLLKHVWHVGYSSVVSTAADLFIARALRGLLPLLAKGSMLYGYWTNVNAPQGLNGCSSNRKRLN